MDFIIITASLSKISEALDVVQKVQAAIDTPTPRPVVPNFSLVVDVTIDDATLGVPRDPEHCAFSRAAQRAIARRFRRWQDVKVVVTGSRLAISYHTKAHPATRFILAHLDGAANKYVRDYDAPEGGRAGRDPRRSRWCPQVTVPAETQRFLVDFPLPPYAPVAR